MDILEAALGDGAEPVAAPAPQAQEAAPEGVQSGGPARGVDGKFAAREAEVSAAPAAAPVVAEVRSDASHAAPLTALLDERDRRQKAEAELATLRARQPQQQQAAPPSVFENEAAFMEWQQTQIQSARLDGLEDAARSRHTDAVVDAMQDWFSKKPQSYRNEVLAQRNPYEVGIAQMKREQTLEKIEPTDLDEYLAWKASKVTNPPPNPIPAAPSARPSTPPPPKSLATMPSASGAAHVKQAGSAFEAVFK